MLGVYTFDLIAHIVCTWKIRGYVEAVNCKRLGILCRFENIYRERKKKPTLLILSGLIQSLYENI